MKHLWKKSAVIAALSFAVLTHSANAASTYSAKDGDTFWELSKQFGISLEQMLKANPMIEPTNIYAGLSIVIPASSVVKTSTNAKTAPKAEAKAAAKAAPKPAAKAAPKAKAKAAPKAVKTASKAAVGKSMKMTSVDKKEEIITIGNSNYNYSEVVQAKASAYTAAASENGSWGAVDYFGNPLKLGTIAVDPKVIPLGSKVYVTGYDHGGLPSGGMMAIAADAGSAIKGQRIDIFIPQSQEQARTFGFQYVKVFVLE
ncbi:3D domain-containing protein [Paenibacillus sp. CF384]|uniref:3D domain-containing protein n=1 Tax=Paenibacillus sp. CF384 TaxID=1884382 RepID=UPI000899F7B1|nr:3D domain-containing protein [Paenibacillus sp. CF384]SDX67872.1 3D (Asp-Asp-Asp) domain-containing protein [Paenibacillus sp. CF384]